MKKIKILANLILLIIFVITSIKLVLIQRSEIILLMVVILSIIYSIINDEK
jgi:hypothetical protein